MSYLGAIENIGANPYTITGDPVMALIAQLNRFAGKSVNPGAKCGVRNYLPQGALPLTTMLDDKSATTACLIVYDSMNCISDPRLIDFTAMAKVNAALTNPIPWAMANLSDVTVRIAQFGDSLGLSPAAVGITKVDPKVAPKFPIATVAIVGALAVAAFIVSQGKKRR